MFALFCRNLHYWASLCRPKPIETCCMLRIDNLSGHRTLNEWLHDINANETVSDKQIIYTSSFKFMEHFEVRRCVTFVEISAAIVLFVSFVFFIRYENSLKSQCCVLCVQCSIAIGNGFRRTDSCGFFFCFVRVQLFFSLSFHRCWWKILYAGTSNRLIYEPILRIAARHKIISTT